MLILSHRNNFYRHWESICQLGDSVRLINVCFVHQRFFSPNVLYVDVTAIMH
ncbi:hypothetical protein K450DRAFT_259134 [Umbelopsis ramanniana AG]|uniref:Uncharacterized protein n=1 Tax=Umbelopsis ramanniana AG TaxID=1314678 RepID=A0AAD5E3E8_UMBRA|nr:uncharacterized protein K450DRAFT_259134 [Umbelopsis ramanniana AG]KAI8575952.1 hypothetical protein K450DRAFT_259134 [Umbelopsis ramanniana AG]